MISALLATLGLHAAPDTGKHVFFTGDAGLVNTSGNTEVTSASVGNKLILVAGRWHFTQVFGVTYARTDDSVTAELWHASLRIDHDLSHRVALFVLTEYDRNVFAGVRSRITPSIGIAALAIAGPRDSLRIEAGGAYTFQQAVSPDTNRDYPAARGAVVFRHYLSVRAIFDQLVEVIPSLTSGDNVRINSETAITAPISRGIALKASYLIHYDGLPEPGHKATDRILSTGVQVTF
ncbi:MAG TPA: DUF481 domain-containing protein [Gemmatimonadales bacterium]|jgi:putative salt-induced outer membrane protein YdiY